MRLIALSPYLLNALVLTSGCQLFLAVSEKDLVEAGHCNDGVDNDDDARIDCADLDCDDACEDICGDGLLKSPEQCDDSNLSNSDGCDEFCSIELLPTCGNGVVDAGEECDDGNQNNLDECLFLCQAPSCNDTIMTPGEECHTDTPVQLGSGKEPRSVASFDLEGDGDLDLASADSGDAGVASVLTIYRNDGAGTFGRFQVNAGIGPIDIKAADINEDSLADLIVANFGGDGADVSLFLNDGAGSFLAHQTISAAPTSVAIAVADLNGDSHLDLVVPSFLHDVVSILIGAGDGSFTLERALRTGADPTSVSVADFDNNGKLDLVTADQASNALRVFLQKNKGLFMPRQEIIGPRANDHSHNGPNRP